MHCFFILELVLYFKSSHVYAKSTNNCYAFCLSSQTGLMFWPFMQVNISILCSGMFMLQGPLTTTPGKNDGITTVGGYSYFVKKKKKTLWL